MVMIKVSSIMINLYYYNTFIYFTGDCNISELLSSLINAQEMFAIQQQVEIKEEGERNMREMIKVEQDEAYQQSLAIDRYISTA